MASNFVHLHTHSHYSLLDGLAKVDDIIKQALEYEMPAIALTEHGSMYSAIEFYKKSKKAGIKPIIGVEVYVAYESLHQKRPGVDNKRYHLVLLAKNETGYKNIVKLTTIANLEGFYYKPRIDKELLRKHRDGIIALSACMGGEIPRLIRNKQIDDAKKVALEYEDILGKGNFYIEIQYHPKLEGHQEIQKELIKIARETKIPLVATQDVHYIKPGDARAQDVLIAIGRKEMLNEPGRMTNIQEDFSFRSPKEMTELFKDTPDAIENTIKIADQCDIKLKLGDWVFPKVDLLGGVTYEEQLKKLTFEGYRKKFGDNAKNKEELEKRIDYELEVINTKGYAPYFLSVSDMINWARDHKIVTNTRGSAAGSFVSYLIGITNVDPIKYYLPFERFLNPFRPSPPDIDMDFADNRRDEVIDYVKEKYGINRVAQIGTFGTMMARGSVRDVARVLGKPYELGDKISKLIPMGAQGFPMTIDRAIKEEPDLKKMYNSNAEVREIIDTAKQIEGCARHISVHAAGVVISPEDLTEYVPLQRESNGDKIITQYDMHAVEDIGLLKFDFLGIKNLAILGDSIRAVRKIYGVEIDLNNLPENDQKTFEMLSRGETTGVFQLGGAGMTKWLKELRPTKMTDIMAMIALFRPGPMDNIPTYIRRKNGKEPVTYKDPRLEKILGDTYGVITYQDDLLYIAIDIAGYDWNSVDKFRKAVGKKIPAEMAKQEVIFIEGCQKHGGLSKENAEELWSLFDPFKGYGFNKAHAASYCQVAYQTAYMKANYPAEFMSALMTADAGDTDKIATAVHECKRMRIPVLPPNINESFGDFTVIKGSEAKNITEKAKLLQSKISKGDQIRFGLFSIKNLGEEIANAIIEERKKRGRFKTFSEFLERVQHKNLNKKSLESLIKTGAMDEFGERNQLLYNMEDALKYNKEISKTSQNQNSLFSIMEDKSSIPELKLKETPPTPQEEKLLWEKDLLGLYISGHPLDKFKDKMVNLKTNIKDAQKLPNGLPVVVAGMIEEAKKIMTKKGDMMVFAKLSDYTDSIELVIFPKTFEQYSDIIQEGNCIGVKGRISLRNEGVSIICEELKMMSND